MNYVLDACAMIALLRGELGGNVVGDCVSDSTHSCLAHAINLRSYAVELGINNVQAALLAVSPLFSTRLISTA